MFSFALCPRLLGHYLARDHGAITRCHEINRPKMFGRRTPLLELLDVRPEQVAECKDLTRRQLQASTRAGLIMLERGQEVIDGFLEDVNALPSSTRWR